MVRNVHFPVVSAGAQSERCRAIAVGLIGAAVAMVLFLLVDLAAGVPLRTPAMLGNALFHGASGAREAAITTKVVLGYTAVHVAGFVLFGLAVSGLFALPSARSEYSR